MISLCFHSLRVQGEFRAAAGLKADRSWLTVWFRDVVIDSERVQDDAHMHVGGWHFEIQKKSMNSLNWRLQNKLGYLMDNEVF
jgi:hypothetical protein